MKLSIVEITERARKAIADCLADVEGCPEPEHFSLAEDILLALNNEGLFVDAWNHDAGLTKPLSWPVT